jgi:hypothetical protein
MEPECCSLTLARKHSKFSNSFDDDDDDNNNNNNNNNNT